LDRCDPFRATRNEDVDVEMDQLRREVRKPCKTPLGVAVLYDQVLALHVAKVT
jgi:predicted TIM-barrel enzyme